MKKIISATVITFGIVVMTPLAAFAHVAVTPNQANVGQEVVFNVSVPNERQAAMTSLKLDIPAGVSNVQPDVTGGWTITIDKTGDTVTDIVWTGNIPVGQREDFRFKAQLPAKAGELDWKAYQTYADKTVVSWDQTPVPSSVDNDTVTTGPYSITRVTNDLAPNRPVAISASNQTFVLVISVIAIVLSALSLIWRRK